MDISDFTALPGEKPLDRIVADGGFCGIFRTVGCVGDSLSSGEFESLDENGNKHYHDFYDYSWGQYFARMAGLKVFNFSRGGMTAKEYCESFAQSSGFWNPDLACQAYIIALGVNDINCSDGDLGSVADIDPENYGNNKPTFAGFYAQIVQRLAEISPGAFFFFVTIPRDGGDARNTRLCDCHSELLNELAHFFPNSYVIDLRKYGPDYDAEFKRCFYLGGHMNPCGYLLTAKMIASYIDFIIRHNIEDFSQVGFHGTPYGYKERT